MLPYQPPIVQPIQRLIPVYSYVPSTSSSPSTPISSTQKSSATSPTDNNQRNFCKFGPDCPNYDHCTDLHPCCYGDECRKANRVKNNTQKLEDLVHCRKCFHICKLGENCKQLKDEEHVKMFLHTCSKSKCAEKDDHKVNFRHLCQYGKECRSLSGKYENWEHYIKFIHPKTDGVVKNIDKKLHYLFTDKKSEKLVKSSITGLTIVKKSSLKAQVKDWKRSAKCEISKIDGKETKYYFIGFEKGNSNSSTSNLVCFKDTGKGVFGGHIKVVPESSCEFAPNVKIEQPWYHSKVNVYSNHVITQVFDEILKQSLNGVSPSATYIDVMKYMIDSGIPIFIVGGAVRDVIREVLVEKKTNAHTIMQNIKDIDIGFGCDPQTFYRILSRKYTSGLQVPGPRGLVQVGIANASDLFLEGKAINGLNNDNSSVKSNVAQCYGTNLRGENICRDFTCNSLWYDPLNKCIIDTIGNGKGIRDVISKKLRIPVKEADWDFWVSGNPTKLMRFYKFLIKGYTADEKTRKYIIDQIINGFVSKMEIRTQYTKGIGTSNKAKLEQLLRADLGDQYYNTHFAQYIK